MVITLSPASYETYDPFHENSYNPHVVIEVPDNLPNYVHSFLREIVFYPSHACFQNGILIFTIRGLLSSAPELREVLLTASGPALSLHSEPDSFASQVRKYLTCRPV